MSGISLAVETQPDSNPKTQNKTPVEDVIHSLRVIDLQLAAFITIFSASGLVPLFDLVFPAVTSAYLLFLSQLVFPVHVGHVGPTSTKKTLFQPSRLFRVYMFMGTFVGLVLPLAYVLGGFVKGDETAIRSVAPHLFLLSFQVLTENVDVAWCWFGRSLAVVNLAYFSINLFAFLIPRFLPRAFEQYFYERIEMQPKAAVSRNSKPSTSTEN
ncbi:hypothetical protein CTI12_AA627090 [Artemisia annua]|uniref:DUF7733 domain-containing protein n=1 Tax=Artemisia annua TaxID=35608 RepID=A0A2U1KA22_ARTAN|nr:hypothetical protein CTI12_AA627090 [Artemisia annua]